MKETSRLQPFLQEVSKELALNDSLTKKINLALEEALINSVQYAYPVAGEGEIRLAVHWEEKERMLVFTLTDKGVPFDPTTRPAIDTTLPLEERPIGGLGIFLIFQMMDEVEYHYTDGCNILIMKKKTTI